MADSSGVMGVAPRAASRGPVSSELATVVPKRAVLGARRDNRRDSGPLFLPIVPHDSMMA